MFQRGETMATLNDLGLADNTLVLFSSDNGPEDIHVRNAGHSGVGSAGPFRGRKRSLYEGGVRVPGIVRWPRKVPAGNIDQQSVVAGVDWLRWEQEKHQTLLARLGLGGESPRTPARSEQPSLDVVKESA